MSISSIGGSAESNNCTPKDIIQHTLTNLHLEGSRIINLHKLHDAIRTITQHSAACKSPVKLIGEAKRNGLSTTLLVKCDKCSEEFLFTSCNKIDLKKPDDTIRSTCQSNVAAVMGQMSTGGSCYSLEELLCTIGVPSISKPTFVTEFVKRGLIHPSNFPTLMRHNFMCKYAIRLKFSVLLVQ